MSKKKKIIYILIGLIIIGAIIFLCSHFILNKKPEEFNGFEFKEVIQLNYGSIDLSDFVKEVTCEEKCFLGNDELTYSITDIKELGNAQMTVSITYQGKTYEHTYEVEIVDEIAPTITLSETEIEIASDSNFDAKDYILEVADNYDELGIDDVEIESEVDTDVPNNYQVIYTLTDASNNTTTETLIVHVIEKEEQTEETKKEETTTNKKEETASEQQISTTNKPNNTTSSSSFKNAINGLSLSPLTTRHPDLDNQISSIISSVTNSGMSNYEKLQAIYNYVKNKLSYEMMFLLYNELWELQETYSYYDFDAMEVMRAIYSLRTGKGVCDNYAALFMILARRIGFDAYVVGGQVNKVGGGTTGHAWVMIKAGGTYYIFDPQIEDSKGTNYDYFGKTDSELPIYHYTLSTHINSFRFFKENPNQPHDFEATFTTSGALTTEKNLASDSSYSTYSSGFYDLGETVNVTFNTSRTQNYTVEILKNDKVISSESYDGSSKTITLTFDEIGTNNYDIKIKVTNSYYVTFGVHGTVDEPTSENTTESET